MGLAVEAVDLATEAVVPIAIHTIQAVVTRVEARKVPALPIVQPQVDNRLQQAKHRPFIKLNQKQQPDTMQEKNLTVYQLPEYGPFPFLHRFG